MEKNYKVSVGEINGVMSMTFQHFNLFILAFETPDGRKALSLFVTGILINSF